MPSISGYSKVLQRPFHWGAALSNGVIMGAGTSSVRITTSSANKNFLQFYVENTATSGDNRGMYLRQYTSGVGGGGDALRVFHTINDVAGATAHGAHISLNFASSGSLTGQGIAARCTLHVPNGAMAGGAYAAVQAEIYSDGADSDAGGVSELSFIRVVNDGHANGIADVDDDAFLIRILGGSIASGNMVAVKGSAAVSHTIRCKVGDTVLYLMASDAQ